MFMEACGQGDPGCVLEEKNINIAVLRLKLPSESRSFINLFLCVQENVVESHLCVSTYIQGAQKAEEASQQH